MEAAPVAAAPGSTLPPLASPESDNSEAVPGSNETSSSANATGGGGGGEAPACPDEVDVAGTSHSREGKQSDSAFCGISTRLGT